jgi:hypothetical protein
MDDQTRLNLIWALRDRLPMGSNARPTHSLGTEQLPDPPAIAGHTPDLLAESLAGTLLIGLAKDGPELDSDEAAEQYRAFAGFKDPQSGEPAALVVVVPGEFEDQAKAAIERAGVSKDRFSVQAVNFPS